MSDVCVCVYYMLGVRRCNYIIMKRKHKQIVFMKKLYNSSAPARRTAHYNNACII